MTRTPAASGFTRVSCSFFARITDGQYLLRPELKVNRPVMRPLGGAAQARQRGLTHLIQKFGVPAMSFEEGRELRFLAPVEQLNDIFGWFASPPRFHREDGAPGVRRMLEQQLYRDLNILSGPQVRSMDIQFRLWTSHSGITSRSGVPIPQTQYMIGIYDVHASDGVMRRLHEAARSGRPRIYFASEAEIREESRPGGYVSTLATTLLRAPYSGV